MAAAGAAISVEVGVWPPTKNEATSVLAVGHPVCHSSPGVTRGSAGSHATRPRRHQLRLPESEPRVSLTHQIGVLDQPMVLAEC